MSKSELAKIVGAVKLDFGHLSEGKTIIKQDQQCEGLCFLMEGKMLMQTESNDHSFVVTETIEAPNVLQPEVLFGLKTRYTHHFMAAEETHYIIIPKMSITQIMLNNEIFRLNLLNLISTKTQRYRQLLWRPEKDNLEQRITSFIFRHIEYPGGPKTLSIKMDDLAVQLDESRLTVSHVLNQMNDKGLIRLSRKEIYIPAFEKLICSN